MIEHILLNSDIWPSWALYTVAMLVIFMLFICIPKLRKILDLITDHLLGISLVIWLVGVGLYTVGAHTETLGFWANVPRAVIASLKMFLAGSDLSRVSKALQVDNTYMTLFSVTHFVAAMLSVLFVMKLIGFRIKTMLDLWVNSLLSSLRNRSVNIFWGVNEASFVLAEDILEKEKNSTVVFVNTNDIYEDRSSQKIGLKSVLDVMSFSRSEIARIEGMEAMATNCHYDLAAMKEGGEDLFKKLKLRNVRRLIRNSYRTRIFLLSEDEGANINSALNLLHDKTLSQHKDATIYIQAFLNRLNDIYNHYPQYSDDSNIKLQIIDSSYLSVSMLRMNPEHHPVNCVSIDRSTGTVLSPFEALLIGFGETGQEAFRFLYEYASFVAPDGQKSRFACHAIDHDMSRIGGTVRDSMPAITEDELKLYNIELESDAYWKLINDTIGRLNYVVISICDDNASMLAALELYRKAIQTRGNDLHGFRIYVRCYNGQNFKRMNDMAQKMNDVSSTSGGKITIFGDVSELYTYDIIVRNRVMEEAMRFNKAYMQSDETPESAWKQSFGERAINDKLEKNPSCTRLQIIDDINRSIGQNIANSFHRATKAVLMGLDQTDQDKICKFKEITDSREPGKTTYRMADPATQELLLNAARCEHLRWVASHKLLGYTQAPGKCMIRKHHNCLCTWEELDELTRSYDCDVVDTGLGMM